MTTAPQTFTVTNNANAGSPSANFSVAVVGDAGAYAVVPPSQSNVGPSGGASGPESVTFEPSSAVPLTTAVALTTSDPLCTPLPPSLQLNGAGSQSSVAVSASTIAFGTDPGDPSGFVNCGATGPAHAVTVTNLGNTSFHLSGLALGLGSNSPYVLSVTGATLPPTVPAGENATLSLTPKPIPSRVANPNDASAFSDTLTITTDATGDAPHIVSLVMQPRGAVIPNTPLATTWSFGTIGAGTIGTYTNTITNTGNASATVILGGLKLASIFGLENHPTLAVANGVTPVVGEFSPPTDNGQWTDQGTVVVAPTQALCEPLPPSWTDPRISLSGAVNANPPVTVSGTLAFPATSCGSAAPAALAITLTNSTSQVLAFTTSLNSGALYTATPASPGTLPAHGTASVTVTPKTVTSGAGVLAGSAPYADDLLVTIQSSPVTTFTIPITWTLNGAVLSLPQGLGPNRDTTGHLFYAADSQSNFELPMSNTGTAGASVTFQMQPAGAVSLSPAPPIHVQPGVVALPLLTSAGSNATCPATTSVSVTLLSSGPVCQPFPSSPVTIQSCVGTF